MKQHHRKPAKKTPADYPRITFRVRGGHLARMDALKRATTMTYGQIVSASLDGQLPILMARHQVKA